MKAKFGEVEKLKRMKKEYSETSFNIGMSGLVKASFLFDDGVIVQFEKDGIVKISEGGKIYIYKSKLFPDGLNATLLKRDHFQNPQLLFKEREK